MNSTFCGTIRIDHMLKVRIQYTNLMSVYNIQALFPCFTYGTVSEYLHKRYEEFTNGKNVEDTRIFICEIHLIKFMIDNAKKKANKETAAMFVQCILKLTQKKSMKEVDLLWKAICKYFGGKEENPRLREELQDIANGVGDMEKRLEDDKHEYTVEEPESPEERKARQSIRKKSPFHSHFKEIMDSAVDPESSTGTNPNPHYNKTLLEYFLNNYLPLLPLFSCIGTANDGLPSNVHVELLFRFYKHHVFNNMQYNTVDRSPSNFFSAIRKMNDMKRKEMKGKGKQKKKKKKEEDEEDSWKKNPKKKDKETKKQNKLKKDSVDMTPRTGAKKRKYSCVEEEVSTPPQGAKERRDSCVQDEFYTPPKIPRNESPETGDRESRIRQQLRVLNEKLLNPKPRKKPVRAKKR